MSIKDVIKKQGWTLEQLAAELTDKKGNKGVKQSSVSQMINGNPTLDKVKEIAHIIGVSPSELIADDSTPGFFIFLGKVGEQLYVANSLEELKGIITAIETSAQKE